MHEFNTCFHALVSNILYNFGDIPFVIMKRLADNWFDVLLRVKPLIKNDTKIIQYIVIPSVKSQDT